MFEKLEAWGEKNGSADYLWSLSSAAFTHLEISGLLCLHYNHAKPHRLS